MVSTQNQILAGFNFELRAQRATKVDAGAYGEHVAAKTPAAKAPATLAELKFARLMIDQAIEQLTPAALRQVQRGNTTNAIGAKFVVAAGRASLDLSGEPSYQKAAERLTAAKDNLKKVSERLTTRGKGELKMGAPSLRVNLP